MVPCFSSGEFRLTDLQSEYIHVLLIVMVSFPSHLIHYANEAENFAALHFTMLRHSCQMI